jgi:ribosomal protein L24
MADTNSVRNGDQCDVVAGTHKGKSGRVEDLKTSKTGAVTLTVRLADDDRIKTLAKNVVVRPKGQA